MQWKREHIVIYEVDKRYAEFKADVEKLADEINAATADYDRKNICYKNAQNTADALERKHQEDKIGKCFWNPYKWNINK